MNLPYDHYSNISNACYIHIKISMVAITISNHYSWLASLNKPSKVVGNRSKPTNLLYMYLFIYVTYHHFYLVFTSTVVKKKASYI